MKRIEARSWPILRRRFWMLEFKIQVLADSHDDVSMTHLRHTVVFEVIMVNMEVISQACLLEVVRDPLPCSPTIGTLDATDILGNEGHRMMCFKHLDTVRVQHAESTLDSLGLTDEAEIVAWEAECEDVDGREGRNVGSLTSQ